MEWLGMLPLLAYLLLIIWFVISLLILISRLLDNSRKKTISRLELEQLQKIELEKRIALLDKELKEKNQT
ncbi:hypothetical protein [Macrococcus animalis]|uniref:hypothetical protein n=1 Tax=Macrococcus animalis TaxID=3395467 RepID=UPI0039BE2578